MGVDSDFLNSLARLVVGEVHGMDDEKRRRLTLTALATLALEKRWYYVALICISSLRRIDDQAAQGLAAMFGQTAHIETLVASHRINTALFLQPYPDEPAPDIAELEPLRLPAGHWYIPDTFRMVSVDEVYELLSEIWQRCQAVPEQRRLKWTVKTLTTVFRLLERRLKQGALMRLVGHVHDLAGPEWQHLAETATGNVVHVRLLYGTSIMVASVSVGGHTKEWPSFMAFLPLGQLSHAVRKFSDSHWPARMLSAGVYELLLRLRSVQPMKELRPLLCRFYDLLLRRLLEHREIAPRIEALGEHPTLVVTTHGALAQIPFAALHNGAEFLAERFNVVQVAHLFEEGDLTVGHMDREALTGGEPTQQPLTFRLLADTVSLPEAHKEAEQYRRMKKRGELEVDIRDGDSLPWTEETLRWLCGGPGVALLSTHLRVSNGGPGEAAIQMPQSSELALGSILRERMHADLLVLSGCVSMAKTDWFAPDEDSLVSRFRNAGAKAVVATLWRVNDLSAYPYNEALVTHLNQGVSRAKAHGAAQRAVMKTPLVLDDLTPPQERLIIEHQAAAPRTQWSDRITLNHPYFWAPFVLTGAWR